jgi:hypothetical protein
MVPTPDPWLIEETLAEVRRDAEASRVGRGPTAVPSIEMKYHQPPWQKQIRSLLRSIRPGIG